MAPPLHQVVEPMLPLAWNCSDGGEGAGGPAPVVLMHPTTGSSGGLQRPPQSTSRAMAVAFCLRRYLSLQVLASLDPSKYQIPDPFSYKEARQLFEGEPQHCGCHARALEAEGWRGGFGSSAKKGRCSCPACLPAEPNVLKGEQVPPLKWTTPDTGGCMAACAHALHNPSPPASAGCC